jgi:GDP-L-fucose synthase
MAVLIAGSKGMVGISLVKEFSSLGHEVIGISRSEVNLLDSVATQNFIKKVRPSVLVCAAARVGGIGANSNYPVRFLEENLLIQLNLMRAAHLVDVEKLVFLGSSCIYPRDCPQPIKEEFLMSGYLEKSNSAYAIAKIAGVELVNSYRKEFGRRWISLMPTNLFGPNDNFDLQDSHVLPALIRRFVEAKDSGANSVTLWGTGKPRREFLHVEDLARAVVTATEKYDSELHLNIGSGEEITIHELARKVAYASGFDGKIEWDASKPDGTPKKVLDATRITALGWKPKITLDAGLDSTIAWFRDAVKHGRIRL